MQAVNDVFEPKVLINSLKIWLVVTEKLCKILMK